MYKLRKYQPWLGLSALVLAFVFVWLEYNYTALACWVLAAASAVSYAD